MEWWQTLLLAGVPAAVTGLSLVWQSSIQSKATMDANASAMKHARDARAHELEVSDKEYNRSREREREERLQAERARALDGILRYYSALQLELERPELTETSNEARRAVAEVLANPAATGKEELSMILRQLSVLISVRRSIAPDDWKKSEDASFSIVDKLIDDYLKTQDPGIPSTTAVRLFRTD